MSDTALYAYAVLPMGMLPPRDAPAVLPGAPTLLVTDAGLAALVSPVPRALFEAGPECRMGDPSWVAERAAAHHALLAEAAHAGTVLPLAFGALFSGEAPLRAWLRGSAASLHEALRNVAGCEEWGVTLTEDPVQHATWLTASDERLRQLAAQVAAAPEGTAFLLEKRRERAVAGARAERRQAIAAATVDLLAQHARTVELTAQGGDRIAGWSALSPISNRAALVGASEAMAQTLAETGLQLRLSGPWPPYAFARGAMRHAG